MSAKKNTYLVTIPIAGHVSFELKAASEEEAKSKAFEMDSTKGEITWETLESFGCGNALHCPSPWEVEVEKLR